MAQRLTRAGGSARFSAAYLCATTFTPICGQPRNSWVFFPIYVFSENRRLGTTKPRRTLSGGALRQPEAEQHDRQSGQLQGRRRLTERDPSDEQHKWRNQRRKDCCASRPQ